MKRYFENLAKALLGQTFGELDAPEQKVIESIAEHTTVAENVNESFSESLSFGERVADSVAAFGGSWTFIGLFFGVIPARQAAKLDPIGPTAEIDWR